MSKSKKVSTDKINLKDQIFETTDLDKVALQKYAAMEEKMARMKEEEEEQIKKSDVICKGRFGEKIKYDHAQQIKHKSNIFNEGPVRCAIVGASGTGKTSLMLELLPLLSDKVTGFIMCTKIYNNGVHNKIADWCKYHKRTYDIAHEVSDARETIERVIRDREEDDHTCLIFDDFITYSRSTEEPHNRFLAQCFGVLRNLNVSIFIITQNYITLRGDVRGNLSVRFAFPQSDTQSLKRLEDDLSQSYGAGFRKIWEPLQRNIVGDKHKFLHFKGGFPPIISINFDEIVPQECYQGKNTLPIPLKMQKINDESRFAEDILKNHREREGEIKEKRTAKLNTRFDIQSAIEEYGVPMRYIKDLENEDLYKLIAMIEDDESPKFVANRAAQMIVDKRQKVKPTRERAKFTRAMTTYLNNSTPKNAQRFAAMIGTVLELGCMSLPEVKLKLKRAGLDQDFIPRVSKDSKESDSE